MAKAKSTEVYGLVSKDLGEVGNQVGTAAGSVGQQVGTAAGAVKKTLEVWRGPCLIGRAVGCLRNVKAASLKYCGRSWGHFRNFSTFGIDISYRTNSPS